MGFRHDRKHPFDGQIPEAIDFKVFADGLDVLRRGDQFLPRGHVDTVIARADDGRRGNAQMNFRGLGSFNEPHDFLHGGAPNDGIVDHDHFFPLEHALDGIEFDANPEIPARLGGMNERPSHVMVTDKPDVEAHV